MTSLNIVPGEARMVSPDHNHEVQLYDTDSYLVELVARFAAVGLRAGDSVLLITTAEHQRNFAAALEEQRFDTNAHIRRGQLVFLDARHTLSRFMVDAMPDPER